ncbi:hypothetical protein FIBSPDRAFT_1053168, partial [Athelia psychrophila]
MSQDPTTKHSIVQSDNNLASEQLKQLAQRALHSIDPPILEIDDALQNYLSITALPIGKPNPTARDRRAVDLGLLVLDVLTCCGEHFKRDKKLVTCFSRAWPALWTWLQFLSDQCCQSRKYGPLVQYQAIIMIPMALGGMSSSDILGLQVASTPGVISMITRYWMSEDSNFTLKNACAAAGCTPHLFTRALFTLIENLDPPSTPKFLSDVIVAAPGGAAAVAKHAIEQLTVAQAEKPTNFQMIAEHITLIKSLLSNRAPQLLLNLLGQGLIPSIVKLLLWLRKQQPANAPNDERMACQCVMLSCFTLTRAIMAPNGPSWAIQALDAGIIPAILHSAPRIMQLSSEHHSSLCSAVLSDTLWQFLVYPSVIRTAAKALERVERLDLDSRLGGPVWEAWGIFKNTTQRRMDLKDKCIGRESSLRTCSRRDCSSTGEDKLLCSGCLADTYCDRACQRMDWPTHKVQCKKIQQLHRDGILIPMTA